MSKTIKCPSCDGTLNKKQQLNCCEVGFYICSNNSDTDLSSSYCDYKEEIFSNEELAYWYFRLNGCFIIRDFVIHPNEGFKQITDLDIWAVRFRNRAELPKNPMEDHEVLTSIAPGKNLIIAAEVTRRGFKINPPWQDVDNIALVLNALGSFDKSTTGQAAVEISKKGYYENHSFRFTYFVVGEPRRNDPLLEKYPGIPNLTWSELISFIYDRFITYRNEKREHGQWNKAGQQLWDCMKNSSQEHLDFGTQKTEFERVIRRKFDLRVFSS